MNEGPYYVVTHPDGTSDFDREVSWNVGEVTHLPEDAATEYLIVSSVVTNCLGTVYPCRLFRVESVDGYPLKGLSSSPTLFSTTALFVAEELPAHLVFGPQANQLAAFLERLSSLTTEEMQGLSNTYTSIREDGVRPTWMHSPEVCDESRFCAEYTMLNEALEIIWALTANTEPEQGIDVDVLSLIAHDAINALIVKDAISIEKYHDLTATWRKVIGPLHLED